MIDLVSLIAIGIVLLAWAKRRRLQEAEPSGLTDSTPRRPQRDPRAGKDGVHRPDGGPRREVLVPRLFAAGSLWRETK